MRRLALALALAWPAAAHMVSMSSGELVITGSGARYALRMPLYEVSHVKDPGRAVLDNIHFTSGGVRARLTDRSCREDTAAGAYLCTASYTFAAPPERLDVECSFHSITVPNHVHLLRAEMDGKRDQALFDLSFPKATLRFKPPSAAEIVVTQGAAGFGRALGGAVQVLFLTALVVAARRRRELVALAAMFLGGQVVSALLTPLSNWQPAPRFVEAAAALTVAYLAVEVLLLPQAGARWLVAGVLGAFHGLYFHLFLQTSGYGAGYVLAGAALADALAITVLALAFWQIRRHAAALRPVQVSAAGLAVFGLACFLLRLRS